MQALGKNVILKRIEKEKKSGLIFTTSEKPDGFYEVVSVGEEVKEVQTGDNVYCHPYHTNNIEVDGQKYEVTSKDQIYAKL